MVTQDSSKWEVLVQISPAAKKGSGGQEVFPVGFPPEVVVVAYGRSRFLRKLKNLDHGGKKTYSFNVNFVHEKLPSFPATSPVRHHDVRDGQRQRTHKQRHIRRRETPATATEHIRRLNRYKQQRDHRTNRRIKMVGCENRRKWGEIEGWGRWPEDLTGETKVTKLEFKNRETLARAVDHVVVTLPTTIAIAAKQPFLPSLITAPTLHLQQYIIVVPYISYGTNSYANKRHKQPQFISTTMVATSLPLPSCQFLNDYYCTSHHN
ncbi:hypothetical protein E3N88_13568 [Mikania micrantha]|uniref:Uncharacterized protein n=1 Tax=Mikania micrantha TaxID=192012 RepID=A0A5N6PA42_9ASTR|nr:hypothetical protein E3N88_13568 [Mikania micrantha]